MGALYSTPIIAPSGLPQAGHPFHLRCAHSAYSHARLKQEAPLFLLFLDCVWQLSRQFPFSLEFGECLLLTLFDNAYASAYGTFLCNNEKERRVGRRAALSLSSDAAVTTLPLRPGQGLTLPSRRQSPTGHSMALP